MSEVMNVGVMNVGQSPTHKIGGFVFLFLPLKSSQEFNVIAVGAI